MRYLLDTHALIWAVANSPFLGKIARKVISSHPANDFAFAAVSLLEVARLAHAGVVNLGGQPKQWLDEISQRFETFPLTPAIAWRSVNLEWSHKDPADLLICATAIEHHLTLISRDRVIHQWGGVPVIW